VWSSRESASDPGALGGPQPYVTQRMKILITGGTGALGREVTRVAEAAGHTVRIGSRRARPEGVPPGRGWAQVEVATGEGNPAAVAGVDAIIHAASDPIRAGNVDVNGTRFLMEAARAAGVGHFVYVSIVGIDQIPLGYYRRKAAAERIVAGSGVPYSILRATQFHTLVDMLIRAAARVPFVIPLPTDFCVQSVAPSDVADRLVLCLGAGPGERLPDFGGPELLTLAEATEQWKEARSVQKPTVRLPLPGEVAAAFRAGKNAVSNGEHGTIHWREWLRDPTERRQ
jgi:uncharacterized protein YbjT (DUF2867 family)